MAGFSYRKNVDGSKNAPTLMRSIGKNSVVFQVGDVIRINTSGFADEVDTGEAIVGVVQTVENKNGKSVTPDSGTLDTWTMNSANQTDADYQYQIVYVPALPHYLFFNDADDSLTRAMEYQYFDTNDENDVDVGSATDTWSAQVQLVSRDPDGDADASKGLFRIIESQWASQGLDRAA